MSDINNNHELPQVTIMNKLVTSKLTAILSMAVCCAAIMAAAAPLHAADMNDFIISYWCGPPSGGNYDQQYAEVAECNFTHAMFPVNGGNPQQNKEILDACQKHGLKYIPSDGRILAHAPGDPKFAANLDAIVAEYANHPAMAGHFITDEPAPGAFPLLGAVNQYLLKKDPERLPFINLLPTYVPESHIGMKYDQYVEQFCEKVRPRLLCYDHYALVKETERSDYFNNMEIIRRNALKYDAAMGFIFQCTPHFAYRDPSETDLRWQVNTGLAYGCRALLYFTYFTPTVAQVNFHNGILDTKGNRTPHFAMAKAINGELKKLIPTLVQLTSTAVYHAAPLPAGCTAVPAASPVHFDDGAPVVLGLFKHKDGSQWAMVVNRDLHKPLKTKLTFNNSITTPEELSPQTGELSPVALASHALDCELPAGGIKVLKLTK